MIIQRELLDTFSIGNINDAINSVNNDLYVHVLRNMLRAEVSPMYPVAYSCREYYASIAAVCLTMCRPIPLELKPFPLEF